MKQLLHCCQGAAVVALQDRAFLVLPKVATTTTTTTGTMVELEAPSTFPATSSTRAAASAKEEDDTAANPIQAVAVTLEEETSDNNDNTSRSSSSAYWCAVSRWNKSLALYRVECPSDPSSSLSSGSLPLVIAPTTIHECPKRVACLGFARVPGQHATYATTTAASLLVVVTGDLTGDAWAWPLLDQSTKNHQESSSTNHRQHRHRQGRLLLGHTASMLTGIQWCSRHNLLLTSDRDEKIRISAFPNTSIIYGFLLGHEAYVSAMDMTSHSTNPLCVTCSGGTDGSVRLWNYVSKQQIAMWSSNSTTNENNKIPSRVAIDPMGTCVAVIYDQSCQLDIFQVLVSSDTNGQQQQQQDDDGSGDCCLKLMQSITCPHAPLAISFTTTTTTTTKESQGASPLQLVVVMKDPSYLQIYQQQQQHSPSLVNKNSTRCDLLFQPIMELSSSCWSQKLVKLAQQSNLIMPDTVIEKDKQGIPTLIKSNETRGNSGVGIGGTHKHKRLIQEMPWNNPKRIDIAKERMRRSKRRRLEKTLQQQKQQQQQQQPTSVAQQESSQQLQQE